MKLYRKQTQKRHLSNAPTVLWRTSKAAKTFLRQIDDFKSSVTNRLLNIARVTNEIFQIWRFCKSKYWVCVSGDVKNWTYHCNVDFFLYRFLYYFKISNDGFSFSNTLKISIRRTIRTHSKWQTFHSVFIGAVGIYTRRTNRDVFGDWLLRSKNIYRPLGSQNKCGL